jgi:hypothetical protein
MVGTTGLGTADGMADADVVVGSADVAVSSGVALAAGRGADVAAGCGDTGAAPAPLPQALSSNSSPSTRAKRINNIFFGNCFINSTYMVTSLAFGRVVIFLLCTLFFARRGEKPGALWATENGRYLAAAGYELRSGGDRVSCH